MAHFFIPLAGAAVLYVAKKAKPFVEQKVAEIVEAAASTASSVYEKIMGKQRDEQPSPPENLANHKMSDEQKMMEEGRRETERRDGERKLHLRIHTLTRQRNTLAVLLVGGVALTTYYVTRIHGGRS